MFDQTWYWDPRPRNPMKNGSGGFPEHTGGTNMDEKDMPDPFQALPGAKTSLKHKNMIDLTVNIYIQYIQVACVPRLIQCFGCGYGRCSLGLFDMLFCYVVLVAWFV